MIQLEAWPLDIELVVNTAKTCPMLFHSSQRKYADKPNIMYNNTIRAYSPNIKFVGITLKEILKWNAHIDIICKSLNRQYFMIKSWKEVSHHSEFYIMHIFSLIWRTVLYFGSQVVIVKKFFVFSKRWYIWFLGLKDVHPVGIVLRHIRL
jgi:hypothetical protein